jgi:ribosomal protein L37AE/L43A
MRAADGKLGALVIDCAGNHRLHGFVTQKFVYSLTDIVKTSIPKGYLAAKECPDCKMSLPTKVAECPGCGYEFIKGAATQAYDQTTGLGRLVPLSKNELAAMQRFWDKLEIQATAWGRQQLWKIRRFEENFGIQPMVVDGKILDPLMATLQQKSAFYVELLLAGEAAGHKVGASFYRYKAATGGKPDYKWAPSHIRKQILALFRKNKR